MTFAEIKKLIEDIPISSVLENWEPETLNGKCCFHDDTNAGSFKYKDDDKKGGMFKCFCCGVTGDKVDFVMKHDNVDFKEATYRIAVHFGKISQEEYKKISSNPTTKPIVLVQPKTIKKVNEAERLPDWYLDIVYSDLRQMAGLTEEHREYLLGRGVKEEDLINYFSMPTFDEKFLSKLKEKYKNPKDFIGVPGFYVEDRKIHGRNIEGIGIPIKNSDGQITAIQVRKDKVRSKEARYIFFSSAGLNQGCSCGAQVDIQLPDKSGSVLITEGHFKAVEICKHFDSTVISVQGVNNTKELDNEIPRMLEKRDIRRFIIAFDADMMHNPAVKKAANKLKVQLEKFDIPTGFMVWDEKFGKGADDVILAGNAKEFKFTRTLED